MKATVIFLLYFFVVAWLERVIETINVLTSLSDKAKLFNFSEKKAPPAQQFNSCIYYRPVPDKQMQKKSCEDGPQYKQAAMTDATDANYPLKFCSLFFIKLIFSREFINDFVF